ncbi:MAG: hypothetical protein JRI34_09270, partial [Deltaproteobacteria bacterium]|nr:hypothetical protein [Deltaproteobacteria bacterium]
MSKKIFISLAFLLIQTAIVLSGSAISGESYPRASNFTLPDLQGKPVSL